MEENPDWNRCIDENSLKLGRCVHSCENNEDCEKDCVTRFKTRQVNCPCEVLKILYFYGARNYSSLRKATEES